LACLAYLNSIDGVFCDGYINRVENDSIFGSGSPVAHAQIMLGREEKGLKRLEILIDQGQ
jgi:hypothetical protein